MATLTTDAVREGLKTADAKAKDLRVKAEEIRDEMVEAGINPMGTSTEETDAFKKVSAAYEEADQAAGEAAQYREKLDRIAAIDGSSGGRTERPSGEQISGVIEGLPALRTVGHRFAESLPYKALHDAGAFRTDAAFASAMGRGIEPVDLVSRDELEAMLSDWNVPDLGATTVTGGGATSVGPFIQNDLVPGVFTYRRKRPLLSSMVAAGQTDSDVVEYVTETVQTDAGAETAEDTAAPESTFAYATNTTNVREITHFVPVTLRAMADFGQIRTLVDNNLVGGALDRLDTQLASGDGTGQNLTGIYNAAGIGTQPVGADNKSAAIQKAMTLIRIAAGVLSEPDFVGMHPSDAETLRLEEDANGNYIFGPPSSGLPLSVWGVPIRISTVFTSGTPLVGDFGGSATLWIREALAVSTGLDGNDFTQRRVSMLAALRIAFAVTRAGGFTTVTGF